jgi:hypothetical protein
LLRLQLRQCKVLSHAMEILPSGEPDHNFCWTTWTVSLRARLPYVFNGTLQSCDRVECTTRTDDSLCAASHSLCAASLKIL